MHGIHFDFKTLQQFINAYDKSEKKINPEMLMIIYPKYELFWNLCEILRKSGT